MEKPAFIYGLKNEEGPGPALYVWYMEARFRSSDLDGILRILNRNNIQVQSISFELPAKATFAEKADYVQLDSTAQKFIINSLETSKNLQLKLE